jgi:hypothetical protein
MVETSSIHQMQAEVTPQRRDSTIIQGDKMYKAGDQQPLCKPEDLHVVTPRYDATVT